MLAERAPFVGIVLALLFVAVETVGLIVYAPVPEPSTAAASVGPTTGSADPTHGYKRIKVRCRR